MESKGQMKDTKSNHANEMAVRNFDFVFDKTIFNGIFEKDIRRVYMFRKSERLAKAIQLLLPAFEGNEAMRARLATISVMLVDAGTFSPNEIKQEVCRELLTLTSLMSIAETSGMLSEMNANLMIRESQQLLQEILSYSDPLLSLEEVPTLAEFARQSTRSREVAPSVPLTRIFSKPETKGHISDMPRQSDRQEAILEILRTKGPSYIKDISTIISDVSEKTIQRELQMLVTSGKVTRSGERRWTQYQLA